MGYQVEEKETKELIAVNIILGTKVFIEYIWAYTLEEAKEKAIYRGLILAD